MTEWTPSIERLQALDDAEWLLVEKTYCGRLLAYALRRTNDLQASEDILQETLLGAVRGIGDFDPAYTFEQYLFGICRNRTVDHLRRRRPQTLQAADEEEGQSPLESLARDTQTPSGIVRGRELSARAASLLGEVLRDWVEETWQQREFVRLCVVEALLAAGWRNRDTWQRFDLRDETSVAGIKFRALKRMGQLAAVKGSGTDLLFALSRAADGEDHVLDLDVREVWNARRASCPARHWIARLVAESIDEESALFVRFHLFETKCPWCRANYDDLSHKDRESELEPLIARVQESTLKFLRSSAGE
jgi:RNA polymerase sigma-70 factor (ECF subfamily)